MLLLPLCNLQKYFGLQGNQSNLEFYFRSVGQYVGFLVDSALYFDWFIAFKSSISFVVVNLDTQWMFLALKSRPMMDLFP